MSNLSIKELENLLKAIDQEDVLKKMTPRSQNVQYLRLMERMRQGKDDWSKLQVDMKNFENNELFNTQLRKKITLVRLFKCVDFASDEASKALALKDLNENVLRVRFNFAKPRDVKTGKLGLEIHSDSEETSTKEQTMMNLPNSLLDQFLKNPNYNAFNKLNPLKCLESLDFSILITDRLTDFALIRAVLRNLRNFKNSICRMTNMKSFLEFLMMFESEKFIDLNTMLNTFFDYLPLSWLESFLKLPKWQNSEELVDAYINKNILNLEDIESEDKEFETMQQIKELYKKQSHLKYKYMIADLNNKMLLQLIDKNEFPEELFREYLDQLPPKVIVNDRIRYAENVRTLHNKNKKISNQYQSNINQSDSGRIVDAFLRHYLSKNTSIDAWTHLFCSSYLQKIFMEVKLLKGEYPEGFENVLSESLVKQLTEKTVFELLKKNKKTFKQNEKIELSVNLKNIETVRVKVFQVNIEQTLLENENINFAKMDLLGLIAKEEYTFNYNKDPLVQWIEKYTFQSIQDETRGVFIVDFTAGRNSSRAVIIKGQLTLLSEIQKLGTLCVILDEDQKICTGSKTGIYIKGTFYPTDESGLIHLPNNDSSLSGKVLITHEQFAVTSNVQVETPEIKMNMEMIYNAEEFRAGNEVNLLLIPRLSIFDETMSLNNISNPNLKIRLESELGNPKTFEFNKEHNNSLVLSEGRFSQVKFTFPPKTVKMEVEFEGKVKLHGKETKTVTFSKNIDFELPSQKPVEQIYLTYEDKKGYIAKIRGRNGELVKGKDFNLSMQRPYLKNTNQKIMMSTNQHGEKVLGQMENTLSFNINMNRIEVRREMSNNNEYYYPEKLTMLKGEGVKLPIEDNSQFYLFKLPDNGNILEDMTETCKPIFKDGSVTVSNLKEGLYEIKLGKNSNEKMQLKVLKGKRFNIQNRRFIKTANCITQLPKDLEIWRLQHNQDGSVNIIEGVVLQEGVQNKAGSVEVILVCQDSLDNKWNFDSSNHTNFTCKTQYIMPNKNRYMNNKQISEEILYVMRRKNQQDFMGNTLEKPTMLLKRHKVLETIQDNEDLKMSKEYGRGVDLLSEPYMNECYGSRANIEKYKLDNGKEY